MPERLPVTPPDSYYDTLLQRQTETAQRVGEIFDKTCYIGFRQQILPDGSLSEPETVIYQNPSEAPSPEVLS